MGAAGDLQGLVTSSGGPSGAVTWRGSEALGAARLVAEALPDSVQRPTLNLGTARQCGFGMASMLPSEVQVQHRPLPVRAQFVYQARERIEI